MSTLAERIAAERSAASLSAYFDGANNTAKDAKKAVKRTNKMVAKITELVSDGIAWDGAHHKQWFLEQIADLLGVEHENEGIAP